MSFNKKIIARLLGIVTGASLMAIMFWYFTIHTDQYPTMRIMFQWVLIFSVFINSIYFSLVSLNNQLDKEIEQMRLNAKLRGMYPNE